MAQDIHTWYNVKPARTGRRQRRERKTRNKNNKQKTKTKTKTKKTEERSIFDVLLSKLAEARKRANVG